MNSGNFVFIITAALVIAAAIVFKAILDYWGRYKYSKLSQSPNDFSNNDSKAIQTDPFSVIKWAAILIGLGTALIIIEIFFKNASPEATFGLMFSFAGIGLIMYYLLVSKREKS
ncbi:MAG: hypothetical protein A2V66_05530 [Ignavibacteria bacterium RBG_13_36_8]|nr:MAG: hypothetical protein A2V66_05530 [Ignavibacteria bacterium RBG_13_36_8]